MQHGESISSLFWRLDKNNATAKQYHPRIDAFGYNIVYLLGVECFHVEILDLPYKLETDFIGNKNHSLNFYIT
tara:strand:+ start:1000 stop:1218 length:219 start_codon:yes stop_codon:yes gene_type:complete